MWPNGGSKISQGYCKKRSNTNYYSGTFTDTEYLKSDLNNYLLSIFIHGYSLNLTYSDYSTGEFYFTEKTFISKNELYNFLKDEIDRISPNEILFNDDITSIFKDKLKKDNIFINPYISENLKEINLLRDLGEYFSENFKNNLKNFLSTNNISDYTSLKKILQYLVITQKINLKHINNIKLYNNFDYLILDESSKRTLEVVKGLNTFTKRVLF